MNRVRIAIFLIVLFGVPLWIGVETRNSLPEPVAWVLTFVWLGFMAFIADLDSKRDQD